uniref:Phosphomannomutase n=1 Tax=Syphacia muris TaxID=451379 RepID=A0A0N5ARG9_9BILA
MSKSITEMCKKGTILLFDVDGTLTPPRRKIESGLREYLLEVRKQIPLGVVGGSDIAKVVEQLGDSLDDVLQRFDYVFAENGCVGYCKGNAYPVQSIKEVVGEERLQHLINFTLRSFSEIVLPVKRGTFIEFRNGMLNLSPIGRSCSLSERIVFADYDKKHGIRAAFVEKLKKFTEGWGLTIAIGGQISIDVFPNGWDKTFCLQYLKGFSTIHFFGDKTSLGGNDYEIYNSPLTIGHSVKDPEDTRKQVAELLSSLEQSRN